MEKPSSQEASSNAERSRGAIQWQREDVLQELRLETPAGASRLFPASAPIIPRASSRGGTQTARRGASFHPPCPIDRDYSAHPQNSIVRARMELCASQSGTGQNKSQLQLRQSRQRMHASGASGEMVATVAAETSSHCSEAQRIDPEAWLQPRRLVEDKNGRAVGGRQ